MKQSEFNGQIMRKQVSVFLLMLILLFQLIAYRTLAQSEIPANKPPTLQNGQKLGNYLRLGYRGVNDQFIVISVKFKITANGFLDTLSISENAPESFIQAATNQLTGQNGHWNPQLVNGKPVKSKWLIARFYIGGSGKIRMIALRNDNKIFWMPLSANRSCFCVTKSWHRPSYA